MQVQDRASNCQGAARQHQVNYQNLYSLMLSLGHMGKNVIKKDLKNILLIIFGAFILLLFAVFLISLATGGYTSGAIVLPRDPEIFSGLFFVWIAIKFLPEPQFETRGFVIYHCLLPLGVFLFLIAFNHEGAFNSLDSFTIGSFALIFTGFLVASPSIRIKPEEQYTILLFSIGATIVLFASGTLSATYSVLTSFAHFTPLLGTVCSSFLVLGVTDIIVVAVLFFGVIYNGYIETCVKKPENKK